MAPLFLSQVLKINDSLYTTYKTKHTINAYSSIQILDS
jgi:hypothetical protein